MAEYGDSLLLMLFWWEDDSEASGCDDWSRSNATDQDRACRGQREGQCVLKRGSVVSEGGFFQYIKKKKCSSGSSSPKGSGLEMWVQDSASYLGKGES